MNEQLKPCPFCGKNGEMHKRKIGFSVLCGNENCGNAFTNFHKNEIEAINQWNARANGWIEVEGAKNIPTGDWMVATCDKESKVSTHIAKCRPNVIVIGGHFHFDMPKVYAYKEIGELPNPPKAASCGE